MRCSLEESILRERAPAIKKPGTANLDEDDSRIVVLDLDIDQWRSFHADTVISAEE
jgi:hypothetical protein